MTTNNKDFKVKNGIQAGGLIESTASGFKFPDGTTQTTAYTGSGIDSTKVAKTGDTMTGLLTISSTGTALVLTSADATSANNSGILFTTTASSTASSRVASIIMDANGADGAGGDYVTMNAFGSGDFTINNRNAAAITFQTNSTERLRIDSSGNVGIGGSPTTKLDVISSAASDLISSVRNTGTTGASIQTIASGNGTTSSKYSYVRFLNSQTSPRDWRLGTYGTDNLTIRDETASSNRLVIDTNGNVGIGLSTPNLSGYGTSVRVMTIQGNSLPGTIELASNLATGANNTLGELTFVNNASTVTSKQSAYITGFQDGTSTTAPGGGIKFTTRADGGALAERVRIDSNGNVLVTGSGGLGYGTGAGGTVTQATSRSTGVTLNKTNGAITLFTAAGSATPTTFTVTNSTVGATDVVYVTVKSATNVYAVFVTATAAGSFNITFYSLSGTASDSPVFNFAVIKGATS